MQCLLLSRICGLNFYTHHTSAQLLNCPKDTFQRTHFHDLTTRSKKKFRAFPRILEKTKQEEEPEMIARHTLFQTGNEWVAIRRRGGQ